MWKPLTAYCCLKNEGLVHSRQQESFKFSSGCLGGGGWVFWCKSCCGCVQVFGSFDASWLQISCQGDKYSTHTELIQFSAQGLHQLPAWSGIKWKGNSVKPPRICETSTGFGREWAQQTSCSWGAIFRFFHLFSWTEKICPKFQQKNSCLQPQNFLLS